MHGKVSTNEIGTYASTSIFARSGGVFGHVLGGKVVLHLLDDLTTQAGGLLAQPFGSASYATQRWSHTEGATQCEPVVADSRLHRLSARTLGLLDRTLGDAASAPEAGGPPKFRKSQSKKAHRAM